MNVVEGVPNNHRLIPAILLEGPLMELLPELTCQRCRRIPSAEHPNLPFSRCFGGHLNCTSCAQIFRICVCGVPINGGPCPLFSKLTQMLPFCCKNRANGCQEILYEDEMQLHFPECTYQTALCINFRCKRPVVFQNYAGHLLECLGNPRFTIASSFEFRFMVKHAIEGAFWELAEIRNSPLNEPRFFLVKAVFNGFLYQWVHFIGFKSEADRYSVTYKLGDGNKIQYKYKDSVKSVLETANYIIAEQNAFVMGLKVAKRIADPEGFITETVEIVDEKAMVTDDDDDSGVSDENDEN